MSRQKSPKNITQKVSTDLHSGDSDRIRMEIGAFQKRIAELTAKDAHKASIILTEWLKKPAHSSTKKKAA